MSISRSNSNRRDIGSKVDVGCWAFVVADCVDVSKSELSACVVAPAPHVAAGEDRAVARTRGDSRRRNFRTKIDVRGGAFIVADRGCRANSEIAVPVVSPAANAPASEERTRVVARC